MNIGFDIDGVLANFGPSLKRMVIDVTGRDTFEPGDDTNNVPAWDWPELRGYTPAEMSRVWRRIKASGSFWAMLEPLPGACATHYTKLQRHHDLYFVTARPGYQAKWQTETWLSVHLGLEMPTVLMSADKGLCAQALNLDVYIDDKFVNALDVSTTNTRSYLLNCGHNQSALPYSKIIRVDSVRQMLDLEEL